MCPTRHVLSVDVAYVDLRAVVSALVMVVSTVHVPDDVHAEPAPATGTVWLTVVHLSGPQLVPGMSA